MKAQGVRPRVWFGERWVTSVFDLFEENLTYFPALLPGADGRGPAGRVEAGRTPSLQELRLHNGTVWRWNRPVYDVVDGVPHLRVENRMLPAGPTVVDILANGAFYFGALHAPGSRGAPRLVADVVRGGRGELHPGGHPGAGRHRLLARGGRGPGQLSWSCAGCCRRPTRA